ncbi:MAG: hypothetical protein ACKPJD_06935, partial [Planctomycetaceae bacterium]
MSGQPPSADVLSADVALAINQTRCAGDGAVKVLHHDVWGTCCECIVQSLVCCVHLSFVLYLDNRTGGFLQTHPGATLLAWTRNCS